MKRLRLELKKQPGFFRTKSAWSLVLCKENPWSLRSREKLHVWGQRTQRATRQAWLAVISCRPTLGKPCTQLSNPQCTVALPSAQGIPWATPTLCPPAGAPSDTAPHSPFSTAASQQVTGMALATGSHWDCRVSVLASGVTVSFSQGIHLLMLASRHEQSPCQEGSGNCPLPTQCVIGHSKGVHCAASCQHRSCIM